MMDRETDTGIVCRLAHVHLGESLAKQNEVLNKLPRDFRGNAEELVKGVHTNLDTVPTFKFAGSALACLHQKVIDYQFNKKHHQAPSRLERMTIGNLDNFHAKRLVCELFKSWAIANRDKDEDELDEQEVKKYQALTVHLLHYYDRWSSKYWPSDNFLETLIFAHARMDDLLAACSNSDRRYVRTLEHIYDACCELVDNALRVVVLGVSDFHTELEQLCQKRGTISTKTLRQSRLADGDGKGAGAGHTFWCTDLGLLVDAALTRADAERCRVGATTPATAMAWGSPTGWSVWSALPTGNAFRMCEHGNQAEAQQEFEQLKCCAVLVGPGGRVAERTWTTNGVFSKVIMEDTVMSELTRRVDQYLALRQAALAESCPEATEGPACETQGAWNAQVQLVKDRWVTAAGASATGLTGGGLSGVAEAFRGAKKVKWRQGLIEARECAMDLPSMILDVPEKLSQLFRSHVQIMGALHGMIGKGGCKEALAAIYALRQRSSIAGQLARSMDEFIDSALLLHGVVQRELFKTIEHGGRLKGQSPPMQRLYLESITACSTLRDNILTEWHSLGLQVPDSTLAEEFSRIDAGEREAFSQLLSLPVILPAITAHTAVPSAPSAVLQIQDAMQPQSPDSMPTHELRVATVVEEEGQVEEEAHLVEKEAPAAHVEEEEEEEAPIEVDDEPGVYRVVSAGTLERLPVTARVERGSEKVGAIELGAEMLVVEIAKELEDGRRRAFISSPIGWVTLCDVTTGHRFAERLPNQALSDGI